ncbi:MAG: phosphoenolpyruvate--protein phosphotransferase [Pseudomonadota bacterium]
MTDDTHWVGSRQLLRRLRDAMARGGTAQERLDRIAQIIARGMVAEVCSVYVMRGDALVLYSTEGLRKDAVFTTRLDVGEGLVGNIAARARPLALADAQAHSQFAFRPETGEEIYHSFLGVPVLRSGRVLGVLTVQNQTQRNYTEEEVETLETVAMVVAEHVAGGDLKLPHEAIGAVSTDPVRLEGTPINRGLATGHAVIHERGAAISQTIAEDPEAEMTRVTDAMRGMHLALDDMEQKLTGATGDQPGDESLDILRAFRMIAADQGWIRRIREAVQSGLTAEAAVAKVQNDTRARMASVSDPYIRDRLLDLDDLAYRLLQHLTGGAGYEDRPEALPEEVVVIARSMGPVELLDYDRSRLRALILDEGTATSHVAIVAKSLDIPVVGKVRGVLGKIEPDDPVFVDGNSGVAYVRPGEDFKKRFTESVAFRDRKRAEYAASSALPPVTADGQKISLQINAGLLLDLEHLQASGAEGVGLYRTEIPFMIREQFPRLGTQTALYREIFDKAAERPVVFRTLDIGGDKILPYLRGTEDENPAMGWRALRIALDRPAILRLQVRALLRAAAGKPLNVMFPLVAEVAEFDAARAILTHELERAAHRGHEPPSDVRVGAMMEVPSLYFQLPQLLDHVDFLSIGSNDLVQFLFACDRGNPRVGDRYDVLSPPVLRFLSDVVGSADAAGVPVSLCGEMAGQPLEAMTLIGLGFRTLSMPPGAIGAVRHMIQRLDAARLRNYMSTLIERPDHTVREALDDYAASEGIAV